MKRQIEVTYRGPDSGKVGTFGIFHATTEEMNDREESKLGHFLMQVADEIIERSDVVELHRRGPFDVPDGETGGGDGR